MEIMWVIYIYIFFFVAGTSGLAIAQSPKSNFCEGKDANTGKSNFDNMEPPKMITK